MNLAFFVILLSLGKCCFERLQKKPLYGDKVASLLFKGLCQQTNWRF